MGKAYKVTSKFCEVTIVVYAESRNEAKVLGLTDEWFEDEEYIEIEAKRERWADKHKPKDSDKLDFCSNSKLFYDNGYYCINSDTCNDVCIMKP